MFASLMDHFDYIIDDLYFELGQKHDWSKNIGTFIEGLNSIEKELQKCTDKLEKTRQHAAYMQKNLKRQKLNVKIT